MDIRQLANLEHFQATMAECLNDAGMISQHNRSVASTLDSLVQPLLTAVNAVCDIAAQLTALLEKRSASARRANQTRRQETEGATMQEVEDSCSSSTSPTGDPGEASNGQASIPSGPGANEG